MSQTHTAIVTGGSAGIGAAICRDMLDAGYEVIAGAIFPQLALVATEQTGTGRA